MTAAVTRLTSKLESKLAEKDYYEAHQLYRTIYFRLQRDIKFNTILNAPEGGPALHQSACIENRVDFIEKNPSYTFLLDFLSRGVETLLTAKELISALDILKLFLAQLNHILFESDGAWKATITEDKTQMLLTIYYNFLTKYFNRLMDVFHAYAETGLEMIQNKSAQSKGFVENDFLSERDQLLENILQVSKKLRSVDFEDASAMRIKNAFIRSYGLPEMHLRNGRLLMRFQEMAKAKRCFLHGQDSFELAKFLYFYHKIHCNESEYEMVLAKHLIRIFNAQLFINAKPGTYSGQRGEKFKLLKINSFTEDEMASTKIQALNYAKEVFCFYLAITKFFLLKDAAEGQRVNTTDHFRKMYLLKYLNFYLIILEEFLRLDDIVPSESSQHFNTKLFRQMEKHFKFNSEVCLTSSDTSRFLTFFGNRDDYAASLSNALPDASKTEGKLYLLKLFHKLRTIVYKDTITFYRKMDRELDFDLMERVFFVYFNDSVPQIPEIREWDNGMSTDALGFFEREEPRGRAGQGGPGIFFNLLSGMAGPSGGAGGGGGANFMDFLNDLM